MNETMKTARELTWEMQQEWEDRFIQAGGELPRDGRQVYDFAQFVYRADPAAWTQLRPAYLTECSNCGCWVLPGAEGRHSALHRGR